jgi:hypothetical protein
MVILSLLYPAFGSITVAATGIHQRGAAIGSMTSALDLGLALAGLIGALAVSGDDYSGAFALASIAAAACAAITAAARSVAVAAA